MIYHPNNITLFFNEYIQEESLKKAFEIFPNVNEKIQYEYKGDRVVVRLPSSLEKNKTYIMTLSSNFADEHNVKLKEDIVIPFSLSSFIHDGKIRGDIYGAFTKPSILLWQGKIGKEEMLVLNQIIYYQDLTLTILIFYPMMIILFWL